MKTLLPAGLLLVSALLLSACANREPPRTASGRKLKLETIRRPHMATVYQYRAVQ